MTAPTWVARRPLTTPDTPGATAPAKRPWYRRRPAQVALGLAALGAIAVADWPHPASSSQRAQDFTLLTKQVDGRQASCSLGVAATIAAYDQVVTGVSKDRVTAVALADQSALDCEPAGNPQLLDMGTTAAPGDLAAYHLDAAVSRIGSWAFPNAAAVCRDLSQLLTSGPQPAVLADARSRLVQMSADAKAAQAAFDRAASGVGVARYRLTALTEVGPGSIAR